jgi:hypothetical protein
VKNPRGADGISMPEFLDLRSQVRSFQTLGANTRMTANLSDDSTMPESHLGAR